MPKQGCCIDAARHRAGGLSETPSFVALARADTRKEKQAAPKVPRTAKTIRVQDDVQTREVLGLEFGKPRRLDDAWTPNCPVTRGVVRPVNPRRSVEATEVQPAPQEVTQRTLLDAVQGCATRAPFCPGSDRSRESIRVAMRVSGEVRQASLVRVFTVRPPRQLM